MKRLIPILLLALCLTGCATRQPRGVVRPLGNTWYHVHARDWPTAWMEVRYLMGEKKAYGVAVWSDSGDDKGHDMLIDLDIIP